MLNDIYGNYDGEPCYDANGKEIPCPDKATKKEPKINLTEAEADEVTKTIQDWNSKLSTPTTLKGVPGFSPGATMTIEPEQTPQLGFDNSFTGILSRIFPISDTNYGIIMKDQDADLFQQNKSYINRQYKRLDDLDIKYVTSVFSALPNTLPKIDGKVVQLSEISTMMGDPTKKKQLLEQATSLENLPELEQDPEKAWTIHTNHMYSALQSGIITQATNILRDGMYYTAEVLDAKDYAESDGSGDWMPNSHVSLFDENHDVISKEQYIARQKKATDDAVKNWMEANPREKFFQDPANRGLAYTEVIQKITEEMEKNNKLYDYDKSVSKLYDEYNAQESKGTNKIASILKSNNPFSKEIGNTGGEIQAVPQTFHFDLDDPVDENGKARPEIKDFGKLLKLTNEQGKDLLFNVGGVQADVPDKDEFKAAQTLLITIMDDIKKGKHKKIDGDIQFQDIVAGEDKYHAYTIKLPPGVLNDYKGTKEAKGIIYDDYNDIVNKGITIYVPKELSEKTTKIGKYSKKNRSLGQVEALLNSEGEINFEIPNAGSIKIIKDKKTGNITVGGYNSDYNIDKKTYDNTPIEEQSIPGGTTFDLDDIFNHRLSRLKAKFNSNLAIKTALLNYQNNQ